MSEGCQHQKTLSRVYRDAPQSHPPLKVYGRKSSKKLRGQEKKYYQSKTVSKPKNNNSKNKQ
jgi:hypothetical protein